MDDARYWQLWAKTGPDGAWHPLVCHLLDVGAVATRLLERHVPPPVLRQMASRLGLTEAGLLRWAALLAALHDLGKASPEFQRLWKQAVEGLRALGFEFGPPRPDQPHGRVSAVELQEHLRRLGFSPALARQAARWVGGHHGVFPTDSQLLDLEGLTGTGAWRLAREWLVARLLEVIAPPEAPTIDEILPDVGLWLAGLTSVADWIGSMSEYFPFHEGPISPRAYFEASLHRADVALGRIGFHQWEPGAPRSFEALFGFPARPLQEAVIELGQGVDEPLFAIIEAPMGEGKTEAALWLGHELGRAAQHAGIYVALPTTATSNQMFQRVSAFLAQSYEGKLGLQLLHGSAGLVEAFSRLRSVVDDAERRGLAPSASRGTVVAEEWFTRHKRGLLSTFAVGTIDQALLGVLRTKHGFVRLYGLAGKTVVLDEVHAYDAYTSRLLDRLVGWLRRLGASVVLLSATLPSGRRRELLEAWGERGEGPAVPYPRISATKQGLAWRRHIPAASSRTVTVRWLEGDLPGAVGALAEAIEGGGCAGLICNTVARAQDAWRLALEAKRLGALPEDTELHLIHARFTARDRQAKEREVLTALGKPSSQARRPARALVIGTQVLEQSLDIDFDWLATDLAPVDLVLQRTGRLWRHERPRPPSCLAAELSVLLPEDAEAARGPELKPHSYLYDEAILLRSWLALRRQREVAIPDGIEALIEEVYTEALPPGLDSAFLERLEDAQEKLERERDDFERSAEVRLLAPASSTDDPFTHFSLPLDEEDPDVAASLRAVTRLGGPSVSVVCIDDRAGQLFAFGTQVPVDLTTTPEPPLAKVLVASSVQVSSPGLVRVLRQLQSPESWEDSPFLRRSLPLVLVGGACRFDEHIVQYDSELGLTWSKTPGGAE